MTRFRFVLATAIGALVALAPAYATTAKTTKLQGTVGPGFTITLKKAGKAVKTLPRGKYSITVSDKADDHNFHLKGPGVNKEITTTPFQGTKTYTVTLKKGKYTYVCDPHAAGMKGSFTVK